jgi:EmrB/QacA subfamily drug resistance transporter
MSRIRTFAAAHPAALLAVLCSATFMSSLDLFIVNVGLRAVGRDVGETSLANLSWILNGYAIVFAALLIPAGRLADRYGNKRAFEFGLAVFSLASLGCALSSDLWLIVALRGLQAVGAAALVPTSLGLILTAIPPERRKASIQVWAISGSLGAAAGPAIGGLLVELSWRWIFVLNVPIGVATLAAAAVMAPDLRHDVETRIPDLLGGLLLIVALGTVSLGLVEGPDWGWGSTATIVSFAVSAVTLAWFVIRSIGHDAPVVHLHLFRNPEFRWANIAMLLVSVSFGIQLLGLVLWMQEGWGWSALQTGLAIAPGPLMVSIAAIGLRRSTASLPAGVVAAIGSLLMGGGGVLIGATLGTDPAYATEVLPGWLIIGAGVGLAIPTIVAAGTSGLAAHQTSTGSAVVQMARQIGSALGVAALIIVLGTATGAAAVDRFADAWYWAGGFALVGAVAALAINPRRVAAPAGRSARPTAAAAAGSE